MCESECGPSTLADNSNTQRNVDRAAPSLDDSDFLDDLSSIHPDISGDSTEMESHRLHLDEGKLEWLPTPDTKHKERSRQDNDHGLLHGQANQHLGYLERLYGRKEASQTSWRKPFMLNHHNQPNPKEKKKNHSNNDDEDDDNIIDGGCELGQSRERILNVRFTSSDNGADHAEDNRPSNHLAHTKRHRAYAILCFLCPAITLLTALLVSIFVFFWMF